MDGKKREGRSDDLQQFIGGLNEWMNEEMKNCISLGDPVYQVLLT